MKGDSGGALYRWYGNRNNKNRAFAIGIVSRGHGCAGKNVANIYTRLVLFHAVIALDEKQYFLYY